MEISQQCVVALTWTLKDTLGEELDVLDEPVEFLVGGHDLLPPIEEALQGHSAGATLNLQIEPEHFKANWYKNFHPLQRNVLALRTMVKATGVMIFLRTPSHEPAD